MLRAPEARDIIFIGGKTLVCCFCVLFSYLASCLLCLIRLAVDDSDTCRGFPRKKFKLYNDKRL